MQTITHTPGPWHVCGVTADRVDPLIRDASGMCVAQAWKPANTKADHINPAANARLIAAAPDLLAALKELCWAARHAGTPQQEVRQIMRNASAAIAKAEGR